MWEWLLAGIDASRPHEVDWALSWHARIMVIAWSIILPIGVIWARFFKLAPGQQWPQQLDNKIWWYGHLVLQHIGIFLMIPAIWLIWDRELLSHQSGYHAYMGWTIVAFALLQMVGGFLRGSKGGPGEELERGAHFDMTRQRVMFEHIHKRLGYVALLLAAATTFTGLWQANAPRFMWLGLGGWWMLMIGAFFYFQKTREVLDTYQAIWGPDPSLPGNQRKPIGFFVVQKNEDGQTIIATKSSSRRPQ